MLRVDLSADYPGKKDVLRDVCFHMDRGEVLGLIGESGSGKSTLGLALLRLLHLKGGFTRGRVILEGVDLAALPESRMRAYRGRDISYVPQSPSTSFSPRFRIRNVISEAWRAHQAKSMPEQAMLELLQAVSLPASRDFLSLRCDQLSVGQGQRLLIGLALLHNPKLIVADEPTSALDLITQQEILRLFREISDRSGTAILYISHDLTSVLQLCDRVAILWQGQIVETGPTGEIFRFPRHPYARRLIGALPQVPVSSSTADQIARVDVVGIGPVHTALEEGSLVRTP